MLTQEAVQELERQAYRVVGSHSAVKVCGWTKKMVKGEGGCYKLKFYGIMSHKCMQMTTSMSCANRCTFCWRGYKAPVSKDWKWGVDDPIEIVEGGLHAHHDLLVGFKGNEKAKALYQQSEKVEHVALSLTGEPITYPRLNESIAEFDERGISTFLVTNATYPEQIKNLSPITQLYISLDAPNKALLKQIDVPLFSDYWERLNESLEQLSQKEQRTCIRMTMIKGMNDVEPENYAALIQKGDPDFLEVKAYMFVGASRQRLSKENMPFHEEVVDFSQKVLQHLPNYEIVAEHIPSRVVMFAKKEFKKDGEWMTWIDFPKFQELAVAGDSFTSFDYLKPTPKSSLGLSGKGTKHLVGTRKEKKIPVAPETPIEAEKGFFVTIDEHDAELDFWESKEKKEDLI